MGTVSQFDSNQVASLMAVIGTAGTADAGGTSKPIAIGADPSSGAMYVYNLGPAGSTSVAPNLPVIAGTPGTPGTFISVRLTDGSSFYAASGGSYQNIVTGTQQTLGTVGTIQNILGGTLINSGTTTGVGVVTSLTNGSIVVTAGTIADGTIRITAGSIAVTAGTVGGKAASGAASVANPVQIAGTDAGGTVYSPLINTAGAGTVSGVGTVSGIGVITTVTNVSNGTIQNSGTVTGVGVVSALTSGSVTVIAGTVGTVGAVGQIHNAGTVQNGTLAQITTVSNISNGTIRIVAGSITQGSITVTAGTVTVGTLNPRSSKSQTDFGTMTAGTIGTLVSAPGASTSLWVTNLTVSNYAGTTEPCVSFGLAQTGNGVLFRGQLGAQGGIQKNYLPAYNGGTTNAALTWNMLTGSGSVSYSVTYFTEA